MSEQRALPYLRATPQHRLGGKAVEAGLNFVTLGIGWLIWNLIVWTDGRTPGHQVLKMRIYSTDTGKPASWGHMALRQFVIPLTFSLIPVAFFVSGAIAASSDSSNSAGGVLIAVGYLVGLTFGLTDIFWIFKGDKRQRLTDIFAKTAVLNECIPVGEVL